jgi:hypothetical protein
MSVKLFSGGSEKGKFDVAAVSSNERCELAQAPFEFVEEACWCCWITQVCLGQLSTNAEITEL